VQITSFIFREIATSSTPKNSDKSANKVSMKKKIV
jgi:hypothetical protein